MDREYQLLMENTTLITGLREIGMDSELRTKDYINGALEAIVSNQSTDLLDRLYKDTNLIGDINTMNIPATMGNVTKFKYYRQLAECIDNMEAIQSDYGSNGEVIQLTRLLHDVIISKRRDFEIGFKLRKKLIMDTYIMSVMCLYELVNVCVIETTDTLRTSVNGTPSKGNAERYIIIKQAKALVKNIQHVNWTIMIKDIAKSNTDFMKTGIATEGIVDMLGNVSASFNVSGSINGKDATQSPTTDKEEGNREEDVNTKGVENKNLKNKYTIKRFKDSNSFGKAGYIIGMYIVLRILVRYFYHCSGHIANWAKTQASIIRFNTSTKNTGDKVKVQNAALKFFDGLSDMIDHKILKVEKVVQKDMKELNSDMGTVIKTSTFELL